MYWGKIISLFSVASKCLLDIQQTGTYTGVELIFLATIYGNMTRFYATQFIKKLLPKVGTWYASQQSGKYNSIFYSKQELILIVGSSGAHRTFPWHLYWQLLVFGTVP